MIAHLIVVIGVVIAASDTVTLRMRLFPVSTMHTFSVEKVEVKQ